MQKKYQIMVIEFDTEQAKEYFRKHARIMKANSVAEVCEYLDMTAYSVAEAIKGTIEIDNFILDRFEYTSKYHIKKRKKQEAAATLPNGLTDADLCIDFC